MNRKHLWRPSPSTSLASGLALIVMAITAITLSGNFDGFVKGLLGGGGAALAVIGVLALSPLLPRPKRRQPDDSTTDTNQTTTGQTDTDDVPGGDDKSADDAEPGWLPSRDSRP